MTISRTTLLDLPIITTGTEAGAWGDVTNNGLTQYLDISIAGRTALTSSDFTAGALTLSLTEGDASATNIGATSAQYATLYVSSLAQNSTITAPSSNRAYRVVNADSTYTLTVKASGQTGVTFPVSTSGTVVFNGTDYQIVDTFSTLLNVDNLRLDGNTLSATNTDGNVTLSANGTGRVQVTGTSSVAGGVEFYEDTDNGTNYVALQAPASVASNVSFTLPNADGTNGQALTTNGSGTLSFTSVTTSPAGSNTQVQYNNSGVFGASSNLTFNGTGISTGNVNVTSSTNPTAGMYLNSTSTSGLSFYNSSSSAIQIYYGRSTIPATTNGVANSQKQFFGIGSNTTPAITIGTNPSIGAAPCLYNFSGHEYLLSDMPFVFKISGGGRGDNTGYTPPPVNGILGINMEASYGGNNAPGRNGIYVNNPGAGLGGGGNTGGIRVRGNAYGDQFSFISQQVVDDPNGGGSPVGFYAIVDTSAGPNDNSGPVGVRVDNATSDNYSKTNGGAPLILLNDRRSGSTSRNCITFNRNTTSNQVGTIATTNSSTSYNTSSDYRLKENVAPMTGALQKVAQLKPVTYTWKIDGSAGQGFIAHELQAVIPQAVTGVKDEVEEIKDGEGKVTGTKPKYQSMDTSFLVATLTAAIQELKAELDSAKQRISVLEAQ